MHIPDGFLDPILCAVTYAIVVIYFIIAYRHLRKEFNPDTITLISALATAIFVAQMLNWPIPGGTSLHFVGGALAGIMLGPFIGFFVMFLVLFVQCIVFHDGGITTLGANILNMAIIDVLVGWFLYRIFSRKEATHWSLVGAFLGGWIGITLAGIAAGIELGLSSNFIYGLEITVTVMGLYHALLGIIEGLITMFVVKYLISSGYKLPLVRI